jgi:hypothetical protein
MTNTWNRMDFSSSGQDGHWGSKPQAALLLLKQHIGAQVGHNRMEGKLGVKSFAWNRWVLPPRWMSPASCG